MPGSPDSPGGHCLMLHELSVTLQGAIPTSKKAQPENECLNTRAFSTYSQTPVRWISCGSFDMEDTNWLWLTYNSMYRPGLSELEGIHLLLNIKESSTFILLLVLSDLGTSYRHSMEFQMILPYYPSLHLGHITRKLDFQDVLNHHKEVIIGNLVDWHGKALTVEITWTVRAMHVKSTNTWKGSHK